MNALHKSVFGLLVAFAAAYTIGHHYGDNILFKSVVVIAVLALLTLAVVRKLLASILQLLAYLIEGIGYGVNQLGVWMVDLLEDYKDGLSRGEDARSSTPGWDKFEKHDGEEVGLDELMEPSQN